MSYDMKTVKAITLNGQSVKKISDINGVQLWPYEQPTPTDFTVTVHLIGCRTGANFPTTITSDDDIRPYFIINSEYPDMYYTWPETVRVTGCSYSWGEGGVADEHEIHLYNATGNVDIYVTCSQNVFNLIDLPDSVLLGCYDSYQSYATLVHSYNGTRGVTVDDLRIGTSTTQYANYHCIINNNDFALDIWTNGASTGLTVPANGRWPSNPRQSGVLYTPEQIRYDSANHRIYVDEWKWYPSY